MTQREIVVRLCEAYVNAGATVEIEKIIKIADYIMAHTNDYNYSYPQQYVTYLTDNAATIKTADAGWNSVSKSLSSVVTGSASDNTNSAAASATITDLVTNLSL